METLANAYTLFYEDFLSSICVPRLSTLPVGKDLCEDQFAQVVLLPRNYNVYQESLARVCMRVLGSLSIVSYRN